MSAAHKNIWSLVGKFNASNKWLHKIFFTKLFTIKNQNRIRWSVNSRVNKQWPFRISPLPSLFESF